MSKLTISGIEKLGPYCPPFKRPLDARLLVTEYNHLADLVSDYGAYPGMIVYVNSNDDKKGLYVYNGESWKPVATSTAVGDIEIPSLENYYTKSEVDEAIDNIDIPEVDLANYITKEQLEEKKYLTSDDIGSQVTYSFSDGTLIITSK